MIFKKSVMIESNLNIQQFWMVSDHLKELLDIKTLNINRVQNKFEPEQKNISIHLQEAEI